jgi:hypothetical protein
MPDEQKPLAPPLPPVTEEEILQAAAKAASGLSQPGD